MHSHQAEGAPAPPVMITWDGYSRASWHRFINTLAVHINFAADGPVIQKSRTSGRHGAGTLRHGEIIITIRPFWTLVMPSPRDPTTWTVRS